uniref:PDZ domain-containing protein n=1 Tax=Steinernema glaseri TaxID=37863 RepID=A0A1I8AR37_9BILA
MTSPPELFDVARAGKDRKQVHVEMSLTPLDHLDVDLCNNLMVRSIGPRSKAIYALIVGDQILDINGQVPNSPTEAVQMIRSRSHIKLFVSRVSNRMPVSIERVKTTKLKRLDGYCYFVVTLQRTPSCHHVGLGIKSFRGKVTVNRVDQRSIASTAYMVGDCILDVNGERVCDGDTMKAKLKESLNKRGVCSTIVERPESAGALQYAQATVFLLMPKTEDPQLAEDATSIGQREMMKYRANMNKDRHLKPALRTATASEDSRTADEEKSKSESSFHGNIVRNFFHLENSASRSAKKKKKGVSFASRNVETKIESDAQNPNLLQKVKRPGQLRSLGLTMLPSMFFGKSSASSSGSSTPKTGS